MLEEKPNKNESAPARPNPDNSNETPSPESLAPVVSESASASELEAFEAALTKSAEEWQAAKEEPAGTTPTTSTEEHPVSPLVTSHSKHKKDGHGHKKHKHSNHHHEHKAVTTLKFVGSLFLVFFMQLGGLWNEVTGAGKSGKGGNHGGGGHAKKDDHGHGKGGDHH